VQNAKMRELRMVKAHSSVTYIFGFHLSFRRIVEILKDDKKADNMYHSVDDKLSIEWSFTW
jgi:hypothetical protein